jgi:hypothetical protein
MYAGAPDMDADMSRMDTDMHAGRSGVVHDMAGVTSNRMNRVTWVTGNSVMGHDSRRVTHGMSRPHSNMRRRRGRVHCRGGMPSASAATLMMLLCESGGGNDPGPRH